MSSKNIAFEQFLQISVHADIKTTKRGISQQKTPTLTQSWSNQFWNPIANISVTLQYEKTSIQKPHPEMKKKQFYKRLNYIHQ